MTWQASLLACHARSAAPIPKTVKTLQYMTCIISTFTVQSPL